MRNNHMSMNLFDMFMYTFMTFFCITILLPFWDMFMMSVSGANYSNSLTLRLWPKDFSMDAYYFVFQNNKVLVAYGNTIYRTVCGTLLTVFLVLLTAYPLSKRDIPYRSVFITYFLIPMFFSGGLIPTYLLIRRLGLIDNLLVYILPGAVALFSVLIVRNFLMSLDKALEDSAFIDGAGYWTVLFRIYVPVSKPVLATIALWSMVGHWNAWFDTLIYIRSDNKFVLQFLLHKILREIDTLFNLEMNAFHNEHVDMRISSKTFQSAMMIITIGPIVAVYPFFQKYFVQGIMVGSVKG